MRFDSLTEAIAAANKVKSEGNYGEATLFLDPYSREISGCFIRKRILSDLPPDVVRAIGVLASYFKSPAIEMAFDESEPRRLKTVKYVQFQF